MSRSLKLDLSNRNDYEIDEGETLLPSWLSSFADKYREQLSKTKTSVEVSRDRSPSITDSINAIVGGKRLPYSSVNDAVDYYADRVGLNEFRKQVLAREILDAGLEAEGGVEKKAITESDSRPELLLKVPGVESYINNVITTNHGAQLPAVLFSILETFSRDGVSESDIDDPALAKYINKILTEKRIVRDVNDANLGKGVGVKNDYFEIGDSNRDPFAGLMPKRVY